MMVSLFTHWLTPHYTNNHRPKILQPIGLAVLMGLFLMVQSWMQLARLSPSLPGGLVLGYASSISPSQVADATNAERAKVGLPPLTINERLNQAATAKAAHMFQNDYWAHVAPDGTTPWVFIKNVGYAYSVAGENLARDFNDTESMIVAWMASPTHKANIIHNKYSQIGIAVVNGKLQGVETTLVVQMFGSPSTIAARTSEQAARSDQPLTLKPPASTPVPVDISVLEPVALDLPQTTLGAQRVITKKTIVSPLVLTKVLASSLIILLVLVLTYDSLITEKRKLHRRVGNNWAHIGLFGVVLLIIILITEGKVL
jgi:hypothetical protein